MKHKYNPGDVFVIECKEAGNFADELIIIVEPAKPTLSDITYKVYNQTHNMFMGRTEAFLDKFYKKVG